MTKNNVERKGFIISAYNSQVTPHCWGKSVYLEAMKESCSLACSSRPAHLLSYGSLHYLLRGCSIHAELSPLPSVINQGNILYICLQAIWWKYFLHWHSSSQINSNHVKLPTNKQTNLPPPPNNQDKVHFISFNIYLVYLLPPHTLLSLRDRFHCANGIHFLSILLLPLIKLNAEVKSHAFWEQR